MMIPKPILKFFPKLFQEDSKAQALATKMDGFLTTWFQDILNMKGLVRPEEIPVPLISELNFFLSANIQTTDTETEQRQKIQNAVARHKHRATWVYDVKPTIDGITGYSAEIFPGNFSDDWILVGDGVTESSTNYWASLGVDGLDDQLGIGLIGGGDEYELAGVVFIDLHNGYNTAILSPTTIAEIRAAIEEESCPAYFKVYLGYVNAGGVFVVYPNGDII